MPFYYELLSQRAIKYLVLSIIICIVADSSTLYCCTKNYLANEKFKAVVFNNSP